MKRFPIFQTDSEAVNRKDKPLLRRNSLNKITFRVDKIMYDGINLTIELNYKCFIQSTIFCETSFCLKYFIVPLKLYIPLKKILWPTK